VPAALAVGSAGQGILARRPAGDASNQSESPMRLVVAMLSLWIGVAIVGMLAKMQQTIKADAQTLMHVPPDRGEPTR
jgi:hypothetical protein